MGVVGCDCGSWAPAAGELAAVRGMAMVTTKLYTAEELWEMPTDEPWELWEGELRKVPGAGGQASGLAGRIIHLLSLFVVPRDLGLITSSDGSFVLRRDPDVVLVPDVAF